MITQNSMYVLGSIFAIGLLVLLVINPVINAYLEPALVEAGDDQEMLQNKFDFVTKMVELSPYIIFFTGIIYLVLIIFRSEKVTRYE